MIAIYLDFGVLGELAVYIKATYHRPEYGALEDGRLVEPDYPAYWEVQSIECDEVPNLMKLYSQGGKVAEEIDFMLHQELMLDDVCGL